MGIVESFNDLPQPAKLGIAGAAVGGVLVILMTRRAPTAEETVSNANPSGPVVLPAGATPDNSGEVQNNTIALVQNLINQSGSTFRDLLSQNQAATAEQIAALQQSTNASIASSAAALQAQQEGQNNALLAMINALKAMIGQQQQNPSQPTSPIQEPIGGTTPPPTNGGGTKPKPPTTGTVQNPSNPGMTMFLRDIKSYLGGIPDILSWVGGSDYGLHSTKHGGTGRAAQAGEKDYNVGLILPVGYDVSKDTQRYDFSTHQNAESTYARWTRYTINIMQGHPNVSEYEASLAALAWLKDDFKGHGRSLYSGGFDFASVPDNYGRGTYWN